MNIRHTVFAIFSAITALSAAAITVDSQPGQLSNSIENPAEVTSLTVTGKMDAADFEFISSEMPQLTSLDLSDVTIAAYNGDPVLYNRTAFDANTLPAYGLAGTALSSVVLPSSITAIGEGALSATAVTSLTVPSSVKTIASGAFTACDRLTTLTIPATVTSVGANVASRCKELATVNWAAGDIPASAFAGCPALANFNTAGSKATAIGDNAFAGCTALTEFAFPSTLKNVGTSAFEGSGIVTADMENTAVKTLGDWAFAKCTDLNRVVFSETTTTLGEGLFFDDNTLRNIVIPSKVTTLPPYIFKGATSLPVSTAIGDNIIIIGDYALKGLLNVRDWRLPADLDSIGTEAMAGWTSLEILRADYVECVPALGDNVWDGVNQSSVTLVVPDSLLNSFSAADQWKEFDIKDVSGFTCIEADNYPASTIKAWFEGSDLHLATTSESPIAEIAIYDIAGAKVIQARPMANAATLDMSQFGQRVYVVAVALADSSRATFKLAR